MWGILCLLGLGVLSVKANLSWDIAVTRGTQFELYKNDVNVYNGSDQFEDLTALAYDPVYDKLYFVNREITNASIFSYDLTTKKHEVLVKGTFGGFIHGLAIDPVKGILFWANAIKRTINRMSMKMTKNDHTAIKLFRMVDDKIPTAIAVDFCKGYLYWTRTNIGQYVIERARYDGSESEVLVSADGTCTSLTIDQETKNIYWGEIRKGDQYSIERADFNGENRKTLVVDTYYKPTEMTISKDSIFWVDSGSMIVWKLSKDPVENEKPVIYMELNGDDIPFGITAYYPVDAQISGEDECKALIEQSQYNSEIHNYTIDDVNADLSCVYNNGRYSGWQCNVSACYNYCLNGNCFFEDGEPKCSCKNGYKGTRCEVNICEGYCVNDGYCLVLKGNEPGCLCTEGYDGTRCEIPDISVKIVQIPVQPCNCNDKGNWDEFLHRWSAVVHNTLQWLHDSLSLPKLLQLGLCLICGMMLGTWAAYRLHLRSMARNNNSGRHKFATIAMEGSEQKKPLDDDKLISV